MVNETADYINLAANGALHGNIVSHPILIRLLGVYVPFHGVEFTPAFDVRSIFAYAFVMSSEAWVVECRACKCVLTCFAVDPLANSANTALWSTGTGGTNAQSIFMQDDGNLELHNFKWQAGVYADELEVKIP